MIVLNMYLRLKQVIWTFSSVMSASMAVYNMLYFIG